MRSSPRLLPLTLLLASCSHEQQAAAPGAVPLTGTVVTRGDFLGQPSSIVVAGEHLVVTDAHAPFIHVISARDGARLTSFGREGAGPGEFRSAGKALVDPRTDGSFWILDVSLRRFSHVLPPRGGTPPKVDQVLNLEPGGPTAIFQADWLNDSSIVATGIYPEGRMIVTDRQGRIQRVIGRRPESPAGKDVPVTVLQHAFTGPITVSPDRQRIAMGTESADRMEIYRADGTLVRELRGSFGFDPVYEVHRQPAGNTMATGDDLRFGYTGMASTAQFIFAMFSGQLRSEGREYSYFGTEVHVYTWAGDRVATFRLDHRARGIAVTPDGQRLYALQWEHEPRVVQYALGSHLHPGSGSGTESGRTALQSQEAR
jgi:hypothetical protein